jgi:predicted phage terminase large subunit-like protein
VLSNEDIKHVALLAFRESAKTVLGGVVYPIWCIAYNKRRFIEFVGSDHLIATKRLQNVSRQLQTNSLLLSDFGNLYFEARSQYLVSKPKRVSYFETTNGIICAALGIMQTPRGDLFDQYRPDLLIGDDIDNLRTVRNPEIRKETMNRLHAEFLSGMADNARAIVAGNMIHRDCLMANLKKRSDIWNMVEVSVRNRAGEYAWEVRWDKPKEEQKIKELGISVYNQEYLLKPIGEEDQIINESWIQYYTNQLKWADENRYRIVCMVDPAVKEKQSSDYTAIEVWAKDTLDDKSYCLDYVHEKIPVEKIMIHIKRLYDYYHFDIVGIEDVAAQNWLIQLIRSTYPEIPVQSIYRVKKAGLGNDKRSRVMSVQYLFQQGKIYFRPEHQVIVDELVDFPVAQFDDLCLAGDTIVLTDKGNIPINRIKTGDFVMTRKGYKKVLCSMMTGVKPVITKIGITGTSDHPVITKNGIKQLINLQVSDTMYTWNEKQSHIEEKTIIDILIQQGAITGYTFGSMIRVTRRLLLYIVKYILITMEKFQKVILYITKMMIRLIMPLKTLRLCQEENTCTIINTIPRTQYYDIETAEKLKRISIKQGMELENGIDQRRAGVGIVITQKIQDLVRKNLEKNINIILPISKETLVKKTLRKLVKRRSNGTVQMREGHGIVNMQKKYGKRNEPVYNLTVEDSHEFFANGVLVHNCDSCVDCLHELYKTTGSKLIQGRGEF